MQKPDECVPGGQPPCPTCPMSSHCPQGKKALIHDPAQLQQKLYELHNGIPTIRQLREDERRLRRTITEAIGLGTWFHAYNGLMGCCSKCGRKISNGGEFTAEADKPCPIPDEFTGSMADAAELLIEDLRLSPSDTTRLSVMVQIGLAVLHRPIEPRDEAFLWNWYIWDAKPEERVFICLLALGKARLEEE